MTPASLHTTNVATFAEDEYLPITTTSDTPLTGLETPQTLAQVVLETFSFCVIWLIAVLGNILVCVVIYRSRRLQSTTNYFVISLAAADITLGIFTMPFVLVRILSENKWIFGSVMCKFVRYVQYVSPGVTMYVLVCICTDRYYTILYPLSFKVTRSGAKKLIAGSWVIMLILAAPTIFFFDNQTTPLNSYCLTYIPFTWQGTLFTAFLVTVAYLVPVTALVIGYTRVFKHIWTSGVGGRTFQRTNNPVPRNKVKIVKMLLIVNVLMFVLFSPFYCVQIWHFVARTYTVDPTVFIAVSWVSFTAGMAKPLVYLIYNSNFRRGCKEVLCMSTMKCYRSNVYSITSTSALGKKNHVGIDTNWVAGRQMESASQTFDRAAKIHKTAWPLSSNSANVPTTTYL